MQMASSNDVGAFHSRKETNKGSSTTTTLDDKGEPLLRPAREREIRRQRSERREKSAFAKRGPKKKNARWPRNKHASRRAHIVSLSPFRLRRRARKTTTQRARAGRASSILSIIFTSADARHWWQARACARRGRRHFHCICIHFFFSSSLISNRVTRRSLRPRSKPRYPLHERSRPKSEGTFSIPHRSRNAPCSRARASDSAQAHF